MGPGLRCLLVSLMNLALQAANVARRQHGIHIKGAQAPAPLQVIASSVS